MNIKYSCKDLYAKETADIDLTGAKVCIYMYGDDPQSASYVKYKVKDLEKHHAVVLVRHYMCCNDRYDLINTVTRDLRYDQNSGATGVIVQYPFVDDTVYDEIMEAVDWIYDIDGMKPNSIYTPCTALGVCKWLDINHAIEDGKCVAVFGRGRTAGKPIIKKLMNDFNVTVVGFNSKSARYDVDHVLETADVIISATGVANLFSDTYRIGSAEIVVDVGRFDVSDKNKKLFYNSEDLYITPTVGGVGLLTRMGLLLNVATALKINNCD